MATFFRPETLGIHHTASSKDICLPRESSRGGGVDENWTATDRSFPSGFNIKAIRLLVWDSFPRLFNHDRRAKAVHQLSAKEIRLTPRQLERCRLSKGETNENQKHEVVVSTS